MEKITKGYFFNPTKGNLKIEEVIEEVINYLSEKPDNFYQIIVGSDSSSGEDPNFPIALVVLRTGEGGRFFLKKIKYKEKEFYSWKQRVLEEVFLSCQLAVFLKDNLEKNIKKRLFLKDPAYQFKYIHADVGEKGRTRDMVKEIIGLIRGNGFEPKIKPDSFAASNVADRFS